MGAAEADVFALWGEPPVATAEQIAAVREAARKAGRSCPPRIQVRFRPIVAATDELAWQRARDVEAVLTAKRVAGRAPLRHGRSLTAPENTGSQRLLAAARKQERYGNAIWTRTAELTGGGGNSVALVGSPETVAEALMEHTTWGWTSFLRAATTP